MPKREKMLGGRADVQRHLTHHMLALKGKHGTPFAYIFYIRMVG